MFATLETLAQRRRELDAAEAAWTRDLAAYDRSDDWRAEGYASAANAVRHACHMSPGVASGHVKLARKLEELPAVSEAFGRGEISRAHAQVLVAAFTPERAAELAPVEVALVDAARDANPRELFNLVRYVTDAIDGDGGAQNDDATYARRRWHMSTTIDEMMKIDALVDAESAKIWETAIHAELERDDVEGDARMYCQANGCDQPPERCEAHHIEHWSRGGPTSLENLQLLCWHHHCQHHAHDAQARAA